LPNGKFKNNRALPHARLLFVRRLRNTGRIYFAAYTLHQLFVGSITHPLAAGFREEDNFIAGGPWLRICYEYVVFFCLNNEGKGGAPVAEGNGVYQNK
jgi:hypothetical protein